MVKHSRAKTPSCQYSPTTLLQKEATHEAELCKQKKKFDVIECGELRKTENIVAQTLCLREFKTYFFPRFSVTLHLHYPHLSHQIFVFAPKKQSLGIYNRVYRLRLLLQSFQDLNSNHIAFHRFKYFCRICHFP